MTAMPTLSPSYRLFVKSESVDEHVFELGRRRFLRLYGARVEHRIYGNRLNVWIRFEG